MTCPNGPEVAERGLAQTANERARGQAWRARVAAPTGRFAPHGQGVPFRMRENARKVEVSVVLEARILRGLICGTLYLRKRGASFPPVGIWHPKTTLSSKKRAYSRTRNGTAPGEGSARACPRLDSGHGPSFGFARGS